MFENLVGNQEIKKLLIESNKTSNVSHSYIFTGIEGIGKRLFAEEFAKSIMCLDSKGANCSCDSCVKFDSKNNPDFMEIEPDGKIIKIEQIRKMQEKIAEKPIISGKKVYIINDADLMNEESQNCLLKTLEEPPEYATIILVVSNESKMLATIRSRCISIKFNKLSKDEIKTKFKDFSDEKIKLLDGSLKNVESIEQKQEEYRKVLEIVKYMQDGNIINLMENSELLYTEKEYIIDILNFLNVVLLEKQILEPIEFVEKTKRKIATNNNYEMCIDYLLINAWNSIHN